MSLSTTLEELKHTGAGDHMVMLYDNDDYNAEISAAYIGSMIRGTVLLCPLVIWGYSLKTLFHAFLTTPKLIPVNRSICRIDNPSLLQLLSTSFRFSLSNC